MVKNTVIANKVQSFLTILNLNVEKATYITLFVFNSVVFSISLTTKMVTLNVIFVLIFYD